MDEYLNPLEKPESSGKGKIILIVLIVILALGLISGGLIYYFLFMPVCGNGEIERGETSETCCLDVGCADGEICEDDKCVKIPEVKIEGTKITLNEGSSTNFNLDGEEHTIEIEEITDSIVKVIIYSEPIELTLNIGETKEVDIDGDGVYDISIKIISMAEGEVDIEIKKIEPEEEKDDVVDEIIYCGKSIDISKLDEIEIIEDDMGGGTLTITTREYDEDNSFVCMGNKLLNCNEGKMIVNSEGDLITLEIKGKEGSNCIVRAEYGDMGGSISSLSNKYIECPYPTSEMPTMACLLLDSDCSLKGLPGQVAGGVLGSLALVLGSSNPDSSCEIGSLVEEEETYEEEEDEVIVVDCGTDLDCFIDASENCTLSNLTNTLTTEIFGVFQNTTSYYEIRGIDATSGKCMLYHQYRENAIDIWYSEGLVQMMLDGGSTQEEIDQLEAEVNQQYDELFEGKDGTCKYSEEDLVDMFNELGTGTLSFSFSCDTVDGEFQCTGSGKWSDVTCEGELYE